MRDSNHTVSPGSADLDSADHYLKCLVRAFLAGIMISVGGCVFIGCTNREVAWVGAVLFAIGLFTIFHFGFDLYTGKVGYALENKPTYIIDLLVIILGNFIGCLMIGYMTAVMEPSDIANRAILFVEARMNNLNYLGVLFKGILCGLLMFIAADYYKKTRGFLGALIAVPVFILSGFEHSIADMFYFASAFFKDSGCFDLGEGILFIIVVIIGNAIGGLLIPLCQKYMYENPPWWMKKEE